MPLEWEPRRGPRSIEERFAVFHESHPEIYRELVRLCRDARAQGRQRIGIRMLWERLRWSMYVEHDEYDFALNDHMTKPYARLIMAQEPDLADIFETRERNR